MKPLMKGNVWIKKPQNVKETHLFTNDLVNFLQHFSLHTAFYPVDSRRLVWERIMWCIVHIIGVCGLAFILATSWSFYTTNPLVTTLYDTLYPVVKVPFPAVAICNNNRISRKAAVEYGKHLSEKDPLHRGQEYFMDRIKSMGNLYDDDSDSSYNLLEFQEFLDMYDSNQSEHHFNVESRMKQLSPKCEEMLLRCMWNGEDVPCTKNSLIKTSKTEYGYCCTFNYEPPFENSGLGNVRSNTSQFVDTTGSMIGLIVLIDAIIDDYFYTFNHFLGFKLLIFEPHEYPDVGTGSATESFVRLGLETFISIDPITVSTEQDTKRYSKKVRDCLFEDELTDQDDSSNITDTKYLRSNCIINCRIRSIRALCGCIPFMLSNDNTFNDTPRCTLEHIKCMSRFKSKGKSVVLDLKNTEGLEFDRENGLYCPDCLPKCFKTTYRVTTNDLPLIVGTRPDLDFLRNITNTDGLAIIRVYLDKSDTWMYRQAVYSKWFEIVSDLGGICGIMFGFSFVNGSEIIYFLLEQIFFKVQKIGKKERVKTFNTIP